MIPSEIDNITNTELKYCKFKYRKFKYRKFKMETISESLTMEGSGLSL